MRLVGLVSTFMEGSVAAGAVRSLLSCCAVVRVFDGPIAHAPRIGVQTDWTQFKKDARVIVTQGEWETDAAKRTAMLAATRRYDPPVWGVVLDGDEALLWGEYLPEQIEYAEAVALHDASVCIGVTLRLTEAGGSMQFVPARVLRFDLIQSFLISSYHMLMTVGVEVSRPNVPALREGQPNSLEVETSTGMQLRRPLQGEPHILHRSFLRAPQRAQIPRQHQAESQEFETLLDVSGLRAAVEGESAQTGGVELWLPK